MFKINDLVRKILWKRLVHSRYLSTTQPFLWVSQSKIPKFQNYPPECPVPNVVL